MNAKILLGKRIKELRKQKGLTQEQLAELIDLETTSLSGIESGRHYPSLPTIEKIARVLGIEIKMLFDFHHLQDVEVLKQNIIDNIDKLAEDKIIFIYEYIMKHTV